MSETVGQSPKAKGRTRIPMEKFVEVWLTSKDISEVAKRTGLTPESAQARASKYRSPEFVCDENDEPIVDKNGNRTLVREPIPLPDMQRGGGAKLDTSAAIELIAKLQGVDVAIIQARSQKLADKKNARYEKKHSSD